jgi:hypothetical protein
MSGTTIVTTAAAAHDEQQTMCVYARARACSRQHAATRTATCIALRHARVEACRSEKCGCCFVVVVVCSSSSSSSSSSLSSSQLDTYICTHMCMHRSSVPIYIYATFRYGSRMHTQRTHINVLHKVGVICYFSLRALRCFTYMCVYIHTQPSASACICV